MYSRGVSAGRYCGAILELVSKAFTSSTSVSPIALSCSRIPKWLHLYPTWQHTCLTCITSIYRCLYYGVPSTQEKKRPQGRVANPRPVAKIKTGRVSQPITDAADATGRDRSWNATRARSLLENSNNGKNIRNLSVSAVTSRVCMD